MADTKKYGHSSYWLGDWNDDDDLVQLNTVERASKDLYRLAASKRAISNFVNIVSGENIPVKFNTKNSYTDGKSVTIGSDLAESKDFDIAVGLALHEGSHIKLSDFKQLRNISNLIPEEVKTLAIKKGIMSPISILKDLWNIIEDRRIDMFVFNSAPGYRDYYRAMYDKYFNDKLIDKALQSDEYTDETIDSYLFRICNIHNKNTRLEALAGLREIFKTIGLSTIDRLKNSKDTFDVALDVFKVILKNVPTVQVDDNQQNNSNQPGDGQSDDSESREMTDDEFEKLFGDGSDNDSDDDSGDGSNGESDMGDGESDSNGEGSSMTSSAGGTPSNSSSDNDVSEGEGDSDGSGTTVERVKLTDRQRKLLEKKIQKQKSFIDGDIRKKTISKAEENSIKTIEESGSEIQTVGVGITSEYGRIYSGVQCIVVKKLTQSLFESNEFPMTSVGYNGISYQYQSEVDEGIRLGTLLGKKLQIRGENRETVFNRQEHGRIDKRMISSLGYGNENVFQYTEIDAYKKANLHISIDASGSMDGTPWRNTMTNVVALCKAVDMIQNLTIQVSFRTTNNKYGTNMPYIVMAYDSRSDKFSKVKKMFGALRPGGTTPEGLCFEAIMNNFLASNNDIDSYFLNISDGEPWFGNNQIRYTGTPAFKHTRKMVKMLESKGIGVLSYFVSDSSNPIGSTQFSNFKEMYGPTAKFINIVNISQVVRTMNELFLTK